LGDYTGLTAIISQVYLNIHMYIIC